MDIHFHFRVLARIFTLALFTAGAVSAALPVDAQNFKVLYSFTGGADGEEPIAGLVFDAAGNLYGTTYGGGDLGCFPGTCGLVFQLSPGAGGWSKSTLHTFTGGSDGGNPTDSLISDTAGNLYGIADVGGVSCGKAYGCGVAFELTPGSSGWTETVLYSFQAGTDGYYPIAGLVFDKHGRLYSTLPNGGSSGVGVVYELTRGTGGWKEKTLYSFNGNGTGIEPVAAPIVDAAGNLYGTTSCCGTGAVVHALRFFSVELRRKEFACFVYFGAKLGLRLRMCVFIQPTCGCQSKPSKRLYLSRVLNATPHAAPIARREA